MFSSKKSTYWKVSTTEWRCENIESRENSTISPLMISEVDISKEGNEGTRMLITSSRQDFMKETWTKVNITSATHVRRES